jgi:hypothetical protein
MLIETDRPGVSRTRLDKMGWRCSDTAAVHFDNVEVPPENLIGPENGGFVGIMRNFNSERLGMAHGCCAMARVALAEAVEWATNRETFGKRLAQHQSIRIKLADCQRQINTTQAWVDLCAWQAKQGSGQPADYAMLKVQATRMLEHVGADFVPIAAEGLSLKPARLYRFARAVLAGRAQSRALLAERGARAVVALGGYVTAPVASAARAMKVPILLVNLDATPGKAREVVFIIEDGKARMIPIQRGISDDTHYEVVEGVQEGMEVITGSFRALSRELEEGKAVTTQTNKPGWSLSFKASAAP